MDLMEQDKEEVKFLAGHHSLKVELMLLTYYVVFDEIGLKRKASKTSTSEINQLTLQHQFL